MGTDILAVDEAFLDEERRVVETKLDNTNDVSRAKEDGAKATYGVLRGDFGPVGHCSRSVWCKKAGRELRAETLELFGERGSSDEGRCGSVQSSCGSCEVAGSFEGKRSGRSYWHVFC